jgi:hypothetical protein
LEIPWISHREGKRGVHDHAPVDTPRATAAVLIGVLTLALADAPAEATDAAQAPHTAGDALAQVRPGQRVRIATKEGRVLTGDYVGTRDGAVLLEDPAGRIPAESIQRAWVRGRAVKKGAIVGGLTLGLAGAAYGALGAAVCESDCGMALGSAAFGALMGAAAGTADGGLVGAAIPRWRGLDTQAGRAEPADRGPVSDRIGGLAIQGGWAKGRDRNSARGGFGRRMTLFAELPGGFAPGLEVGRFDLGSGDVPMPGGAPLHFRESVLHFGLCVTKTREHGRLRPYGIASIGHYSWHGFDSFALSPTAFRSVPEVQRSFRGASLGGGAHYHVRRNVGLDIEGRWHTSIHKVAQPTLEGPAQHWNMVSITAGTRLAW